MADVETAFGPFVAAYLTTHGWGRGAIGTVLTINSSLALASQVPAGWMVDSVHRKRLILAACLACVAGGALLIALFPNYWAVTAGEALHGLTGGAVRTAIVAVSIGLVGHRAFHNRVGRNHRFDSLGNATTAAGMGLLGNFVSPRWPFFVAAGLCVPAFASIFAIRGSEISYARARQAPEDEDSEQGRGRWSRLRELLRNRGLLVLAASLFLFQFTNASILPLLTERLMAKGHGESELITSALVVVPQVTAGIIATFLARKADEWGRRRLMLLAFAALLLRTALFALPLGQWAPVGIQVLGGLDAAVIGILTPLIVADCTKGSGRYNVALGATSVAGGVGATLSTTVTGFMAAGVGFFPTFVMLACAAALGVTVLWLFLPETVDSARSAS